MSKYPIQVRFPNESYAINVYIKNDTFKPMRYFDTEVFGYIDDVYVAVNRAQWEELQQIWKTYEKI